jgi:hypothetical protein
VIELYKIMVASQFGPGKVKDAMTMKAIQDNQKSQYRTAYITVVKDALSRNTTVEMAAMEVFRANQTWFELNKVIQYLATLQCSFQYIVRLFQTSQRSF